MFCPPLLFLLRLLREVILLELLDQPLELHHGLYRRHPSLIMIGSPVARTCRSIFLIKSMFFASLVIAFLLDEGLSVEEVYQEDMFGRTKFLQFLSALLGAPICRN